MPLTYPKQAGNKRGAVNHRSPSLCSLSSARCFFRLRSSRLALAAAFLACCSGVGGAFRMAATASSKVRLSRVIFLLVVLSSIGAWSVIKPNYRIRRQVRNVSHGRRFVKSLYGTVVLTLKVRGAPCRDDSLVR